MKEKKTNIIVVTRPSCVVKELNKCKAEIIWLVEISELQSELKWNDVKSRLKRM